MTQPRQQTPPTTKTAANVSLKPTNRHQPPPTNRTAQNPPENFGAAARRFDEAVEALEDLRSNAATLTELKTQQTEATQALKESNAALHTAVESLAPVGELGTELLAALKETVAAAGTVFDQDTIKAVRDDVATLSQEVTQRRETITVERDEARQQLAVLQAKVRSLPERVRNKHDLA